MRGILVSMGDAARRTYSLGGWLTVATGAGHGLMTAVDCVRPTFMTPSDDGLLAAMRLSSLKLVDMSGAEVSLWRAWLGFNLAFSLGAVVFGLVCVGLGRGWFLEIRQRTPLRFAVAAVSVCYFVTALCCWFYAPQVAFGAAALLLAHASVSGRPKAA